MIFRLPQGAFQLSVLTFRKSEIAEQTQRLEIIKKYILKNIIEYFLKLFGLFLIILIYLFIFLR